MSTNVPFPVLNLWESLSKTGVWTSAWNSTQRFVIHDVIRHACNRTSESMQLFVCVCVCACSCVYGLHCVHVFNLNLLINHIIFILQISKICGITNTLNVFHYIRVAILSLYVREICITWLVFESGRPSNVCYFYNKRVLFFSCVIRYQKTFNGISHFIGSVHLGIKTQCPLVRMTPSVNFSEVHMNLLLTRAWMAIN